MTRFLLACLVYGLCAYVSIAGKDKKQERDDQQMISEFNNNDPFFPQSLSVALILFENVPKCNGVLIQAPKGHDGYYVLTTSTCFWARELKGNKRKPLKAVWKISGLEQVKVQFGVTPTSKKAECGVADIRINPDSTTDPDSSKNFAIVFLAKTCPLGPQFVPFSVPIGFPDYGLFNRNRPTEYVRTAYTADKNLVAHLERKCGTTSTFTRLTCSALKVPDWQQGKDKPSRAELAVENGAPLWSADYKPDFVYGLCQNRWSTGRGSHESLKLHARVSGYPSIGEKLQGYLTQQKGLSFLYEALNECSEQNKDKSMCWSSCGKVAYPCWSTKSGTHARGTILKKACDNGEYSATYDIVQSLCGKLVHVEQPALKPGHSKTSQLFRKANAQLAGEAYDYYMYSEQDIDDDDIAIEKDLDEELDEMMQEMFLAGYSKGVQQKQHRKTLQQSKMS